MKPRDFLNVLENPDAPALPADRDEGAEHLLLLIVHMFFADGRLDEGEIALMQRLVGADEDAEKLIVAMADRTLDLDALAAAYPDPKDRDDIVTVAEHAVWGDDHPDYSEWDVIDKLVDKLGVVRD